MRIHKALCHLVFLSPSLFSRLFDYNVCVCDLCFILSLLSKLTSVLTSMYCLICNSSVSYLRSLFYIYVVYVAKSYLRFLAFSNLFFFLCSILFYSTVTYLYVPMHFYCAGFLSRVFCLHCLNCISQCFFMAFF